MRNTPKPILIILAPILIAVAVGLVYDLQNFLQDIPEIRDNPMLLAGVAVFIPMLVALVKDTFDAHGLQAKVIFVELALRKRTDIFQSQV